MDDKLYGLTERDRNFLSKFIQDVLRRWKTTEAGPSSAGGPNVPFIRVKLQAAMHHDKGTDTDAYRVFADGTEDTSFTYKVKPGDCYGFWPEDMVIRVQLVDGEWHPIGNGFPSVVGTLSGSLSDNSSATMSVSGTSITVYTKTDWIASGSVASSSNITANLANDGKWYIAVGPCPA